MSQSLTKVLIVDDERLIRQGILHYINWQDEGFEVVGEAANGEEARELIDVLMPDIVITDIVMPVMNGTDLIKYIKSDYPTIEVIVLSSYADFDYVRDTFKHGVVDYILKPKLDGDLLLETLKRVEKQMKQHDDHKQTLPKEFSVSARVQKVLKKYHHEKDLFELNQFLHGRSFQFVELKRSDFTDKTVLTPFDVGQEIDVTLLESDEQHVLFFFVGEANLLQRTIEEITKKMAAEPKHVLTILYSKCSTDAAHILSGYDEIKLLRRYHFFLSDYPSLSFEQLPSTESSNQSFDLSVFLTLFKQQKFDVALQYMDDYMTDIKQHYQSEPNEIKNLLGNIIFNMVIATTENSQINDHFEQKKYQYFNVINHSTTLTEGYFHFQQFYDELTAALMTTGDRHDHLSLLLHYIDEHYNEPLSLTDLSAHFHFNASYLSSYFSQHLNKGFSDYLTDIRIKKAKELLQHDNLSIADVGSMVGYQDHSYFCKVFKKKTKQSPSRYRKEAFR